MPNEADVLYDKLNRRIERRITHNKELSPVRSSLVLRDMLYKIFSTHIAQKDEEKGGKEG